MFTIHKHLCAISLLFALLSTGFPAAHPMPVFASQTSSPKDCDNDLECFIDAAKSCTQAYLKNSKQLGFLRAERLEIQGEKESKCLYYASSKSGLQNRGFACQFYTTDGLVTWIEMITRRRKVIYDSRAVAIANPQGVRQRTIETINGEDVAECLWR